MHNHLHLINFSKSYFILQDEKTMILMGTIVSISITKQFILLKIFGIIHCHFKIIIYLFLGSS